MSWSASPNGAPKTTNNMENQSLVKLMESGFEQLDSDPRISVR
jgi:hypothetical protein